jgi:16S rRNA (guanine527-N7)-methyltransferase
MNLTRISNARDAAVKHVLDSVLPWRFFQQAQRVLDAGTGAGFPGIPLAIVLPEVRFTLSESIQKKARFVDGAVEALDLPNVHVSSDRAEALASGKRYDIVTARAVAPVERIYELFSKFVRDGGRLLLFKGPEVSAELAQLRSRYAEAKVIHTYDLPDGLGARTLVAIANHEREPRTAS